MSGRRPKLTPQVQARMLEAIKAGSYLEQAAQYAGIGTSTFHRWLERGRKEQERLAAGGVGLASEERYREFWELVTHARAEVEVSNVALVTAAGRGGELVEERTVTHPDGRTDTIQRFSAPDWRGPAWFLERSFPQRWRRRDRVELTGEDGGAVKVEVARDVVSRKIEEAAERLRSAQGESDGPREDS